MTAFEQLREELKRNGVYGFDSDYFKWHEKEAATAVSVLCVALKKNNSELRRHAANILSLIHRKHINSETVDALCAALDDSDISTCEAVLTALSGAAKASAIPAVANKLASNNVTIRVSATSVLGSTGDLKAMVPIFRSLQDADKEVRRAAAQAIDNLIKKRSGDEQTNESGNVVSYDFGQAVSLLGTALQNDKSQDVRYWSAVALKTIDDLRAVPALCRALKDKEQPVRVQAAEALQRMGERYVPQLNVSSVTNNSGTMSVNDAVNALRNLREQETAYLHALPKRVLSDDILSPSDKFFALEELCSTNYRITEVSTFCQQEMNDANQQVAAGAKELQEWLRHNKKKHRNWWPFSR